MIAVLSTSDGAVEAAIMLNRVPPGGESRQVLALGATLIASLLLGALIQHHVRRRRSPYGRAARAIASRAGLSRAERRLLARISQGDGYEDPDAGAVALIVSEGCFEHAMARAPGDAQTVRRLAAIRRRLFAPGGA